jgi:hypothetical protein
MSAPEDRGNAVLISASIIFAALVITAGMLFLHFSR